MMPTAEVKSMTRETTTVTREGYVRLLLTASNCRLMLAIHTLITNMIRPVIFACVMLFVSVWVGAVCCCVVWCSVVLYVLLCVFIYDLA